MKKAPSLSSEAGPQSRPHSRQVAKLAKLAGSQFNAPPPLRPDRLELRAELRASALRAPLGAAHCTLYSMPQTVCRRLYAAHCKLCAEECTVHNGEWCTLAHSSAKCWQCVQGLQKKPMQMRPLVAPQSVCGAQSSVLTVQRLVLRAKQWPPTTRHLAPLLARLGGAEKLNSKLKRERKRGQRGEKRAPQRDYSLTSRGSCARPHNQCLGRLFAGRK